LQKIGHCFFAVLTVSFFVDKGETSNADFDCSFLLFFEAHLGVSWCVRVCAAPNQFVLQAHTRFQSFIQNAQSFDLDANGVFNQQQKTVV